MGTLPPPRVRSSKPAVDYARFFQVLQEALDLYAKSTQVPDELKPLLVEDYPKNRQGKFDHSFDVITFSIVEAQPAAMSNDGSRRQQAPMLHDYRPHPTKAKYHLVTFGWKEEATIQFTVHAKSNARANELAAWFQRFLMAFIYGVRYFASYGVEKFYFLRRLEDAVIEKYGQELYVRPIQYHVRLNFLDHVELKDLEFVQLDIAQ